MPEDTAANVSGEQADAGLAGFIRRLPKAELHLHIEGTLEPELLLELGRRNGVDLPCSSAGECRAQYRFSDLQAFLDIYYEGVAVLVRRAGLLRPDRGLRAPRGRRRRAARGGVLRPAEPRAAGRAVRRRRRRHHARPRARARPSTASAGGSSCASCATGRRPRPWRCWSSALPHRDVIAGVGLDSAEAGHPPAEFAAVLREGAGGGLRRRRTRRRGGPARVHQRGARRRSRCAASTTGSQRSDDAALQRRLADEQRAAHDVPAQQPRAEGDAGPLAAPAQGAARRRAGRDA